MTMCPVCGTGPLHASECDDLDRCAVCARLGQPLTAGNVIAMHDRIDRIRSIAQTMDALRRLPRDEMMLVIGYGIAQPRSGGLWSLLLTTMLKETAS